MPIIKRRCSGVESRLRARMGDRAHGKPYASHAVRVILWGREEGRTGRGGQRGRGLRTAALHERSRGALELFPCGTCAETLQEETVFPRGERRADAEVRGHSRHLPAPPRKASPPSGRGRLTQRTPSTSTTTTTPSLHRQADLSLRSPEMRRRGSKVGGGGGFWCRRGRQAPRAIHLHKRQDQRSTQE